MNKFIRNTLHKLSGILQVMADTGQYLIEVWSEDDDKSYHIVFNPEMKKDHVIAHYIPKVGVNQGVIFPSPGSITKVFDEVEFNLEIERRLRSGLTNFAVIECMGCFPPKMALFGSYERTESFNFLFENGEVVAYD